MHACNKLTCNQEDKQLKKNTRILYLPLGRYKRPLFKESRPEIPRRRKEKGKVQVASLSEFERDVASWTLDFNKKANRMLVEREIFLEVKKNS